MDISDGLVQDLGHLCRASGCGAEVDVAALPLSPAGKRWVAGDEERLMRLLTGGDDYQLLCTVPPAQAAEAEQIAAAMGISLTRIGITKRETRINFVHAGRDLPVDALLSAGYQHRVS